ncbi:prepilin-type N-terminal cleavage/methylation domain-containing protein, partial [Candidatus Berkelbacteria bacterium]|nr:prepilin-type N-terminal cleavage/methylation domain-containing protein [Candidatus Berkelbacteria bacterium]
MMRRRGFTLIELMVTTALLGGILIVLGIILSGSYQQTAFLTGRGAMTGSVTNALETITSYALLG